MVLLNTDLTNGIKQKKASLLGCLGILSVEN